MDNRVCKTCLLLLLSLTSGCATTQYAATEIPSNLIARQVRDYSQVDLTPFAVAEADSEMIRPGDRLNVQLNTGTQAEDSTIDWTVGIDDKGETDLPNIGRVRLAGLTASEARHAIVNASLSRDVFLTPTVDVALAERESRRITVTGAVVTPGEIIINSDTISLADAIVRAGGITEEAEGTVSITGVSASTNRFQSVSTNTSAATNALTVSLASNRPQELAAIPLTDGTVVHVEQQPLRIIKVTGVIRDQAIELPPGQNVRLLDAIALAGGQTYSNWISDRVTVVRRIPNRQETVRIDASIRDARDNDTANMLLAADDVVIVEENALTFTLSTLSGFLGAGFSASQIAGP